MSTAADFNEDRGESGGSTLRFTGDLSLARLGNLPERLDSHGGDVACIDLSGIERIDTIGAWVVHRFAREHKAEIRGLSGDANNLLEQVVAADQPVQMRPGSGSSFRRVLAEIGDATAHAAHTAVGLLGFMGATIIAFGGVIRHPSRFRFNATVQRFEVVGVSALGIVGLMSFLIGIVIAQQGAVQLRQFGAESFTINLVGRITLRELGVLMTAIMVAGRSGSAFAAQLGTMQLTEEIDAMRTIGVSPMEALVLPRTIAAIVLMPLLGFYSSIVAIIGGGLLCWMTLDIPPVAYIARIREVVPITDLFVGLIKAPVFGAIIAVAGCFQGMQVKGDAEQVGLKTTSAVVQAIFMVIVLDAFFAVFFEQIGWNLMPHFASNDTGADGAEPVIRVTGLRNSFGEQVIHEDLDLEVRRGEILGVVGGSGTGKSVLMRSIIGLQTPDAGEVRVFGEPTLGRSEAETVDIRKRWGVLFQGGALFSTLTVAENVQVPLREFYPDLSLSLLDEIASYKVVMTGLPADAGPKFPAELSGGMKKRAGLARALALDPDLLFLDEPTAGLDPIGAAAFDELTASLQKTLGLTVFLITHDLDTLYAICDRVAVLADRRVIAVGTIPELLALDHPWIQEYFNGPRGRAAVASQKRAAEHEPAAGRTGDGATAAADDRRLSGAE